MLGKTEVFSAVHEIAELKKRLQILEKAFFQFHGEHPETYTRINSDPNLVGEFNSKPGAPLKRFLDK